MGDLNKSADKVREAAEHQPKGVGPQGKGEQAQREADTASAEAFPELMKHEHSKAKPPRRD